MPRVIDANGVAYALEGDDLTKALASGQVRLAESAAAVDAAGNRYGIGPDTDPHKLRTNPAVGFETDDASRGRREAAYREELYGSQNVRAGLEGVASGLTLGASDVALDALGADTKERAEYNPNIRMAGELTGIVGASVIPGLGAGRLGQVLAKTPAGFISAKTAQLGKSIGGVKGFAAAQALEGAGYAVGQTASQLLITDEPLSAETMWAELGKNAAFGAGAGAAGGLILGGLGKGYTALKKARAAAPVVDMGSADGRAVAKSISDALNEVETVADLAAAQAPKAGGLVPDAPVAPPAGMTSDAPVAAAVPDAPAGPTTTPPPPDMVQTAGSVPGFGPVKAADEVEEFTSFNDSRVFPAASKADLPKVRKELATASNNLTPRQTQALKQYHNLRMSYDINDKIRTGKPLSDVDQEILTGVTEALQRPSSKLPRDMMLYRGVRQGVTFPKAGEIMVDDAPMFSSFDQAYGKNFSKGSGGFVIEIEAEAGARGLPLVDFQESVLLPPQAKLHVVSADPVRRVVRARYTTETAPPPALSGFDDAAKTTDDLLNHAGLTQILNPADHDSWTAVIDRLDSLRSGLRAAKRAGRPVPSLDKVKAAVLAKTGRADNATHELDAVLRILEGEPSPAGAIADVAAPAAPAAPPAQGLVTRTERIGDADVEVKASFRDIEDYTDDPFGSPTVWPPVDSAKVHAEAWVNGKRVGSAQFKLTKAGELYPEDVYVDPAFRRKGIASKLYDSARESSGGRKIVAASDQTDEGQRLSETYRAKQEMEPVTSAPPVATAAPFQLAAKDDLVLAPRPAAQDVTPPATPAAPAATVVPAAPAAPSSLGELRAARERVQMLLGTTGGVQPAHVIRLLKAAPDVSGPQLQALDEYLSVAKKFATENGDVRALDRLAVAEKAIAEAAAVATGGADKAGLRDLAIGMTLMGADSQIDGPVGDLAGVAGAATLMKATGSSKTGRRFLRRVANGSARALGGRTANKALGVRNGIGSVAGYQVGSKAFSSLFDTVVGQRAVAGVTGGGLGRIAAAFESMGKAGATVAARAQLSAMSMIRSARFDYGQREEKPARTDIQTAYRDRLDELAAIAANPMAAQQAAYDQLADLRKVAPYVADELEMLATAVPQFLYEKAPKDPGTMTRLGQSTWKAPEYEIRQWGEYVKGALAPLETLEAAMSGRITPQAAEAVRALFPNLFGKMQEQLVEQMPELRKRLDLQARTRLSILFDAPLDSTMLPEFRGFIAERNAIRAAEQQQAKPRGSSPGGSSSTPPAGTTGAQQLLA